MREIDLLVVHCTATPEGRPVTIEEIKKWHTDKPPMGRGFMDIGYHWVIALDGTIMKGRNEELPGAHTEGHNAHSIGIAYVGGMDKANKKPKDTRTPEQKESLLKLLKQHKTTYPGAVIRGHRDFAAKACPSFDATKEYKAI